MKFTREEFEELRDEISNIFSDELGEYFHFTRSSYHWSSQHDFIIHINVKANWREFRSLRPEDKIRLLKDMFDSVSSFINDEEKNFTFINVDSKQGLAYCFTFQPTSERVKKLLTRG